MTIENVEIINKYAKVIQDSPTIVTHTDAFEELLAHWNEPPQQSVNGFVHQVGFFRPEFSKNIDLFFLKKLNQHLFLSEEEFKKNVELKSMFIAYLSYYGYCYDYSKYPHLYRIFAKKISAYREYTFNQMTAHFSSEESTHRSEFLKLTQKKQWEKNSLSSYVDALLNNTDYNYSSIWDLKYFLFNLGEEKSREYLNELPQIKNFIHRVFQLLKSNNKITSYQKLCVMRFFAYINLLSLQWRELLNCISAELENFNQFNSFQFEIFFDLHHIISIFKKNNTEKNSPNETQAKKIEHQLNAMVKTEFERAIKENNMDHIDQFLASDYIDEQNKLFVLESMIEKCFQSDNVDDAISIIKIIKINGSEEKLIQALLNNKLNKNAKVMTAILHKLSTVKEVTTLNDEIYDKFIECMHDQNLDIKTAALSGLKTIGLKLIEPDYSNLINSLDKYANHSSKQVKIAAINALKNIVILSEKTKETTGLLLEKITDNTRPSPTKLQDKNISLSNVEELLKDNNNDSRSQTKKALMYFEMAKSKKNFYCRNQIITHMLTSGCIEYMDENVGCLRSLMLQMTKDELVWTIIKLEALIKKSEFSFSQYYIPLLIDFRNHLLSSKSFVQYQVDDNALQGLPTLPKDVVDKIIVQAKLKEIEEPAFNEAIPKKVSDDDSALIDDMIENHLINHKDYRQEIIYLRLVLYKEKYALEYEKARPTRSWFDRNKKDLQGMIEVKKNKIQTLNILLNTKYDQTKNATRQEQINFLAAGLTEKMNFQNVLSLLTSRVEKILGKIQSKNSLFGDSSFSSQRIRS
jgi:hypothetical protein